MGNRLLPQPEDCPRSKCSRRQHCTKLGQACSGLLYERGLVYKIDCKICPVRGKCQAGRYFDYNTDEEQRAKKYGTWKRSDVEITRHLWETDADRWLGNQVCRAVKRHMNENCKRRNVRIEQTALFPIFGTGTQKYHEPGPAYQRKNPWNVCNTKEREPESDEKFSNKVDGYTESDGMLSQSGEEGRKKDNPRAADTSEQPDFPLKGYGIRSHHRLPNLIINTAGHIVCDVDNKSIIEDAVWYGREWGEAAFNWREDGWIGREWYEADANGRAYSKDHRAERIRKIAGWHRRGRHLKPISKGLQHTLRDQTANCYGPDGKKLSTGECSLLFLPRRKLRAILWFLLYTTKSQREIAGQLRVQRRQVRAMVKRIRRELGAILPMMKHRRRLDIPIIEGGILVGKRPVIGTLLPPMEVLTTKINNRRTNAQIARKYNVTDWAVGKLIKRFESTVCLGKVKVDMNLIR